MPLGWLGADKFAATVEEDRSQKFETRNADELRNARAWRVLFDAAAGKIVRKRRIGQNAAPVRLLRLTATKALFEIDHGIYAVALADAVLTRLSGVEGSAFGFSPDGTKMAFFNGRRVLISSPGGAGRQLASRFPKNAGRRRDRRKREADQTLAGRKMSACFGR